MRTDELWVVAVISNPVRYKSRYALYKEFVHQLQHYKVIQCFQDALDLGPAGEVVQQHRGFAWSYATGRPEGKGYYHCTLGTLGRCAGRPGTIWAA